MPVDITDLLLNCAAAFGIGVLWYDFTKTIANLYSKRKKEDVSSGDSSYVNAIDEEKAAQMTDGDW